MRLQPGEPRRGRVFPRAVGGVLRARFERDDNSDGLGTPYTDLDVLRIRATFLLADTLPDPFVAVAEYNNLVIYGESVSGLVTAAQWFNALQSWREDPWGHNFRWRLPAAFFTTERVGKRCAIDVAVELIDGNLAPLPQRWEGIISANAVG